MTQITPKRSKMKRGKIMNISIYEEYWFSFEKAHITCAYP